MTRDTSHRLALVGDIGGTNARLALVQPGSHTLQHIQTLACAEHAGLEEAIQAYYRMLGLSEAEQPVEACLAFACPVHDERVSMTNNHWTFLKREVRESLRLERFKCLNDFTAMALGVPHIEASERLAIGEELTEGSGDAASPRLVIGPGTGLGVAGLVRGTHNWIPLATEGGMRASPPPTRSRMACSASSAVAMVASRWSACCVARACSRSIRLWASCAACRLPSKVRPASARQRMSTCITMNRRMPSPLMP